MSSQGQGQDESYTFSEDVSAKRFHVLKDGTTTGSALLADTAGGLVLGILQDTGVDGSTNVAHALVRVDGESMCKIGGTISIGDPLQADTDGMAIIATTADEVFARAKEDGVDLDIIRVQISAEGIF